MPDSILSPRASRITPHCTPAMEPSPGLPRSVSAMDSASTATATSACASGPGSGSGSGSASASTSATVTTTATATTTATTVDHLLPSIATAHLARFEFSDLGTKILMVEWHPGTCSSTTPSSSSNNSNTSTTSTASTQTNNVAPIDLPPKPDANVVPVDSAQAIHATTPISDATAWEISWPGKSTFLPARDTDQDEAGTRRRVYFLLPPDAPIPASVTISPPGRPSIVVKPLPAIFPPGFDVESGTRGVLHTLWAKKRLSELQSEMDAEMRANAESVGLEMALAEKQWIIDNFLPSRSVAAPLSPRSPVPGRLGDKLKGLRLATSPEDLIPNPTANTFTGADVPSQTLSPLGGDVAVSSFSVLPRGNGHAGTISLNAALEGHSAPVNPTSRDGEDDLFALPLSPRSPDMKRGPFSALS